MITANVIHRIFWISYGDAIATGFTVNVEDREYLVTAKHVLAALSGNDTIGIFSNGGWSQLPVTLVGHAPDDADISVLATNQILTPPELPMGIGHDGLVYGQDVYFLGFPYGWTGKYVLGEGGYPLPFVKKATVSLLDHKKIFLDGHNNRGFSGGPVVFTERTKNTYKVAGVISGYRFSNEPVYSGDDKTELTYQYNTGIIVAHDIDWVNVLVQANPIGHEII